MSVVTAHTCTKHEPGSLGCHRHHGCRCDACKAEVNRRKKYARAGAAGMVSTIPVRAHIDRLLARGYTLPGVGTKAGLTTGHVRYLYHTAKRCHRDVAAAILAVEVPAGDVDATPTVRRIHALAAAGWSYQAQSVELGLGRAAVSHWAVAERVSVHTAQRIADLYERLWDQTPTGPGATYARNRARREGFVPAAAWDDGYGPHGIDNPAATPHPWQRARKTVHWEDVLELAELGVHISEMSDRLGITPKSIEQTLARHGRGDLRARIIGESLHRQKRTAA